MVFPMADGEAIHELQDRAERWFQEGGDDCLILIFIHAYKSSVAVGEDLLQRLIVPYGQQGG